MGFVSVHALEGDGGPEVLLVPLAGHTRGHSGIAVRTDDGWLLHCGDAYFYRGEMDVDAPHCTTGLRIFQQLVVTQRTPPPRQPEAAARAQAQARQRGHPLLLARPP